VGIVAGDHCPATCAAESCLTRETVHAAVARAEVTTTKVLQGLLDPVLEPSFSMKAEIGRFHHRRASGLVFSSERIGKGLGHCNPPLSGRPGGVLHFEKFYGSLHCKFKNSPFGLRSREIAGQAFGSPRTLDKKAFKSVQGTSCAGRGALVTIFYDL
jgi:hypothetical protein